MRRTKAKTAAVAAMIVGASIIVVLITNSGGEPSYRGKTVTEWLDRLALYDKEQRIDGTRFILRSGDKVTNNPAFQALLQFGSNAVPILLERVAAPAEWSPETSVFAKTKMWVEWKWSQRPWSHPQPRPAPRYFSEAQMSRKTTAGLILLALGTNANAGFTRYMETYAGAPKHKSIYGTEVAGAPIGVSSGAILQIAASALPERHEEIVDAIHRGLYHTNVWCRTVAIECVSAYPDELTRWKDRLAELTKDEDPMVRQAALGEFMMMAQSESALKIFPPATIRQIAEKVEQDSRNSQGLRDMAVTVRDLAAQAESETPRNAGGLSVPQPRQDAGAPK